MADRSGRFSCAYSRALFSSVAAAALIGGATSAYANPQGGVVVSGTATIAQTSPTQLDVTTGTSRTIIDWTSFSIGAQDHTRITQPTADSSTLNRVTGGTTSEIFGRLSSNGHVVLVNPNGIVIGPQATIDVAGIVATTTGIKNENFLAGRMIFDAPGRPDATVLNQGTVSVKDGGLAAFVAPGVQNAGVIQAKLGTVSLASGNKFTVDLYGDKLVKLQVGDAVANDLRGADGQPLAARVDNKGTITADGGTVFLTVDAARSIVDNVINTSGVIQARQAVEQGGRIVLKGRDGNVTVGGTVEASNSVDIWGKNVTVPGAITATNPNGTVMVAASEQVSVTATTSGGSASVTSGPGAGPTPRDRSEPLPLPIRGIVYPPAPDDGNSGSGSRASESATGATIGSQQPSGNANSSSIEAGRNAAMVAARQAGSVTTMSSTGSPSPSNVRVTIKN